MAGKRKGRSGGEAPARKIEYGTGAFTWTAAGGRVCLKTLSDRFYFRVSTSTAAGAFLAMAVDAADKGDEGSGRFLAAYASVMMEAHSVVPCHDRAEGDSPEFDFLSGVHKASLEAVRRHPDLYGAPKNPVEDEEDKKILEGERRLRMAEDSLKDGKKETSVS